MKSKKYGGNKTINILNEISAGLFMSSFHSPALHTVTPIDRNSFNTHKQTLFMTTDTYGWVSISTDMFHIKYQLKTTNTDRDAYSLLEVVQ